MQSLQNRELLRSGMKMVFLFFAALSIWYDNYIHEVFTHFIQGWSPRQHLLLFRLFTPVSYNCCFQVVVFQLISVWLSYSAFLQEYCIDWSKRLFWNIKIRVNCIVNEKIRQIWNTRHELCLLCIYSSFLLLNICID